MESLDGRGSLAVLERRSVQGPCSTLSPRAELAPGPAGTCGFAPKPTDLSGLACSCRVLLATGVSPDPQGRWGTRAPRARTVLLERG